MKESEVGKILIDARERLEKSLSSTWESLWWEPAWETPEGEEAAGYCFWVDAAENQVVVLPGGELVKGGPDEISEFSVEDYVRLAPLAELRLKNLILEQWQEIEKTPEGRDVLWRPGQRRFGIPRVEKSPGEEPLEVRAKKDGLYCPQHPDKKLISDRVPSQGAHYRFTTCPNRDCSFSVFNGT